MKRSNSNITLIKEIYSNFTQKLVLKNKDKIFLWADDVSLTQLQAVFDVTILVQYMAQLTVTNLTDTQSKI